MKVFSYIPGKHTDFTCSSINEELSNADIGNLKENMANLPECSLTGKQTFKEIKSKCNEFYDALEINEFNGLVGSFCMYNGNAYMEENDEAYIEAAYTLKGIKYSILDYDELNDKIENSSISQKLSIMILLLSLLLLL